MSIRAMNWAWSISLAPTVKLVLMALADIADDQGACWPSHLNLAAKCTLTDRTVRRVLVQLQTHGLICIEPRFKSNGSRTSNRYRLAIGTPLDKLSGASPARGVEEVTDDLGTRTPAVRGLGHPCPGPLDTGVLGTTIEPSLESSQPLQSLVMSPHDVADSGGGDFIYPKALTPRQQQALHGRLAMLTHHQAQQVLDELSGRMAIALVKNPVRYCATLIASVNHGRFSPELGLRIVDARLAEARRRAALTAMGQVFESRPTTHELPAKFREAIRRLRLKSRSISKNDD